jgi:hypothetical protein
MLDMFKAGLIINIIGIMVVIVFYYGDFSLWYWSSIMPDWAKDST